MLPTMLPTASHHRARAASPLSFNHMQRSNSPSSLNGMSRSNSPLGFNHMQRSASPSNFNRLGRSQSPLSFNHDRFQRSKSPSILGQVQQVNGSRLKAKKSSGALDSWASSSSISSTFNQSALEVLLMHSPNNLAEGLRELRYMILVDGVPANPEGMSSLRVYVWSVLLGVPPMPTSAYLKLVRAGPSSAYSKIRDDTFRTLATDPLFHRKVSEASLTRVLNSYVISRERSRRNQDRDCSYVQGMNVIAAPFLYSARSEHEAYALFEAFVRKECPAYIRPTLDGVHKGLKLVDKCMKTVAPGLFSYLQSKNLKAELYAFPSVMTFSACTPPLPEVCILWDFLLAYGAHLNILCVVAQLILMADELMSSHSPVKILRHFPPLHARKIISVAVGLIPKIPEELFEDLINHTK